MPPRRAAKPITSIKRTGELDQDYTIFENEYINDEIDDTEAKIAENIEVANQATIERREMQKKYEARLADKSDLTQYLQRKFKDKEEKKKIFERKLDETNKQHAKLEQDIQARLDKLRQSQDLELSQLTNILKANKVKRDSLATVAALENQLKREIAEAENTLKTEKQAQSVQMSNSMADYYNLFKRHERELAEGIEKEMQKNRGMTAENLERTVIEMMREKDAEKTRLANEVKQSKVIADMNTELMDKNKQLYMNRDLLQSECDSLQQRIMKNDATIRALVEELREHDQKITKEMENSNKEEEENNEKTEEEQNEQEASQKVTQSRALPPLPPVNDQKADSPKPKPDREQLLMSFFDDAVNTLCTSIVKILQVIDPNHSTDYMQFHDVFNDFEGRKKELRFLMSKLGNLTFTDTSDQLLPPIGLESIEGADEDYTMKNLVDPQNKAIQEFAGPIGDEEYPDLIATHFFQ